MIGNTLPHFPLQQCLFLERGSDNSLIFLRIVPYFFRGRGKILQRKEEKDVINSHFLIKIPQVFGILE
jgi:hypothetical protein